MTVSIINFNTEVLAYLGHSSTITVFSESFFPFGKSSGDTLINITLQNGHSGPIKLNSPLPFFGEIENGPIYVSHC